MWLLWLMFMRYVIFANDYDALVDRVYRCLSSRLIIKMMAGEYCLDWQRQAPDVFLSACLLVMLRRTVSEMSISRISLMLGLQILSTL